MDTESLSVSGEFLPGSDLVASTDLSSNTAQCQNCEAPFGYIWERPHHCRRCNACICDTCSQRRVKIFVPGTAEAPDPTILEKRVCNDREKCDYNRDQMVFEDPWTQRIHEETLRTVLFCAIHGQYSSSSFQYVQSTAERGNRYLEQTNGDPEKAFQECEEYNYSWWASFVNALWASIPLLGIFTSVSRPTWRALRDLSLIAYLNGYDLMDSEVQQKILDCLATPYLRSVAASATTGATVQIAENSAPVFSPIATNILLKQQAKTVVNTGVYVATSTPSVAGYVVGGGMGSKVVGAVASKTGATNAIGEAAQWGLKEIVKTEAVSSCLQLTVDSSAMASKFALYGACGFVFVVGVPVNMLVEYLTDKHAEILEAGKASFPNIGDPVPYSLPVENLEENEEYK